MTTIIPTFSTLTLPRSPLSRTGSPLFKTGMLPVSGPRLFRGHGAGTALETARSRLLKPLDGNSEENLFLDVLRSLVDSQLMPAHWPSTHKSCEGYPDDHDFFEEKRTPPFRRGKVAITTQ